MDVTKERSTLNWYQIGMIIVGVASTAWTLAGIYFEFRLLESEIKTLENRIEYVNDRIDKKTNQNKSWNS